MCVPNLHTAPKRHLIQIRTFLRKIDSYLEKYKFARRLKGLDSYDIQVNRATVPLRLHVTSQLNFDWPEIVYRSVVKYWLHGSYSFAGKFT